MIVDVVVGVYLGTSRSGANHFTSHCCRHACSTNIDDSHSVAVEVENQCAVDASSDVRATGN